MMVLMASRRSKWKDIPDLYPNERSYRKPYVNTNISSSREELRINHSTICRVCKLDIYSGDNVYYFPKTNKYEHINCNRNKGK